MPASTLVTFDDLCDQVGRAIHNFSSHTFRAALTNSAPNAATNTVLADITQIAATGGYTAGAGGGYLLDSLSYSETGGVATLNFADEVITAAGGSVGPFRYIVIYNDSATSPADALVGYLDYGSALTLADTESLTLDFGASGVLQLTS